MGYTMSKRYEVRTNTLCEGWVNCWTVDDQPDTYDTPQAAQNAIDEHITDMKAAYVSGEMGDGEEFDEDGERAQLGIFIVGSNEPYCSERFYNIVTLDKKHCMNAAPMTHKEACIFKSRFQNPSRFMLLEADSTAPEVWHMTPMFFAQAVADMFEADDRANVLEGYYIHSLEFGKLAFFKMADGEYFTVIGNESIKTADYAEIVQFCNERK